jgi:hypothetical protein
LMRINGCDVAEASPPCRKELFLPFVRGRMRMPPSAAQNHREQENHQHGRNRQKKHYDQKSARVGDRFGSEPRCHRNGFRLWEVLINPALDRCHTRGELNYFQRPEHQFKVQAREGKFQIAVRKRVRMQAREKCEDDQANQRR